MNYDLNYITPQPLHNNIFGVQANFCVSYPNRVILRVKCIGYTGKKHLGSNPDLCYIQNCYNELCYKEVQARGFRCSSKSDQAVHSEMLSQNLW